MATPDMGKMYGPLPLGAWLAVIAGGLGLALYTRRQNAAEVPTDPDLMPEDTGTTPGVGVGGSGQWTNVGPPANGAGPTNSAETNEEWARMAILGMVASLQDPAATNSAVNKFLNEQQLTAQEMAIISLVLKRFGPPPTPVQGPFGPGVVTPPPSTNPPAVARWPVPKVPFFQYTIRNGDTLPTIAWHYGMTPLNLYLWNAVALDYRARLTGNKVNSQRGKYIYAGTVLNIPWRMPGQVYRP
jgi:LysM domain